MNSALHQLPAFELWPISVDWDLAFSRPQTIKARAYWQSLCRGRRMPSRRDLEPRAMKEFIGYVNLVDVLRLGSDDCDYIITLQTNHARDVWGNIQNRPLSEMFPPEVEQRWHYSFDLPRKSVLPVRLATRASTVGKNWLACEILLAPLGQGNEVEAIFWVAVAWPSMPAAPPS
ncbi:MAG TPA: PAS domain-containing protein [Rhizomicrobium sp.]|jgi:hypothetical protein